jgi:hypothetical protein
MQPEAARAPGPDPSDGLPPVVPPTGGYLARLFLVPGLIVLVVVLVFWAGTTWILGWVRTPEQYLKNLDDPSADVRWVAAHDLAEYLLRDETLASDPKFALTLSERLRRALDESAPAEQALAARSPRPTGDELEAERKSREADRMFIHYLMGCLSNVRVPAGVPLLKEVAEKQDIADAEVLAQRRHLALFSLARLGEKVKGFDNLSEARQQAVLAALEEEAAAAGSRRAEWARDALAMLQAGQTGKPRLGGLDAVFERCAADADADLRKMTAFALNFWDGNADENARLDTVLANLARDDGRTADGSFDPVRALEVRYNAAVALARRGSDRVRLDLLQEMLDEAKLRQDFRTKPEGGGPSQPDESAVRLTVVSALKAAAELHRRQPGRDLSPLYPAIRQLTHSPDVALRGEADATLKALGQP